MFSVTELLASIPDTPEGITLAELLIRHPDLARRTAQRWIGQLLDQGKIAAYGAGPSRHYRARMPVSLSGEGAEAFLLQIPISADSRDILAYVGQPIEARKPVGYQRDFLDAYEPGRTWYLPDPLRRQLRRMGDSGQAQMPAGTHSSAILDRLLIDLSWASSHLEGNTYTRLDTRELIEHGTAAQGKAAIETQMILNHKAAIEFLVENAGAAGFDRYTLLNLHSALSENLLPIDPAR